jgi:hypothetical protein
MEEFKGRRPAIPAKGFRNGTNIKGGDKSSDAFDTGKSGGEYGARAPKGKNPGAKYTERPDQIGEMGSPEPRNSFAGNAHRPYHEGDVMKGVRITKETEQK